jgi:hypothetical protein
LAEEDSLGGRINWPLLVEQCAGETRCSFNGKEHVRLKDESPMGEYWTRLAQAYPDVLCDDIASLVIAAARRGSGLLANPLEC